LAPAAIMRAVRVAITCGAATASSAIFVIDLVFVLCLVRRMCVPEVSSLW
jgi:hypothetical protein